MRAAFKKHFIPHEENNYHPHFLHTKRAVLYAAVGIVSKMIVFFSIMVVPLGAFMAPDVLSVQTQNIIELTNELRKERGRAPYRVVSALTHSADNKAGDMAEFEYFGHTSPDGRAVAEWIQEQGYDYEVAGENLAMGFYTAEDVVAAWRTSSTHYANLIDSDFEDVGVGIASGQYGDAPTIYIAQHFGAARPTQNNVVATVRPLPPVTLKRQPSSVDWKKGEKGTVLSAKATIDGPVKNAKVQIKEHTIPLESVTDNVYTGSATIAEEPTELFQAVIPPALTVTDEQGAVVRDTVDWTRVAAPKPGAVEKYRFAKSIGSAISGVFEASRWIYLGFIVLFSIALILNIFIEFRKQHPHVIVQTAGLIALFVLLLNT